MNPLISMIGASTGLRIDPGVIQSARRMMGALSRSNNPASALRQAASQNPMLSSIMAVVGGRDPRTVFYELCQQNNIDPAEILNQLK